MKLAIIFSLIMFGHFTSTCQVDSKLVKEFNDLIRITSKDKSNLEISNSCAVLDVERPALDREEEFQYNLKNIKVLEPEKEMNYWSLDIVCTEFDKCIWVNRDRGSRSKDFRIWEKEDAILAYEMLKSIQEFCSN